MLGAFIIAIDNKTRENQYHPLTEVGGISALKHLVITLQKSEISPIIIVSKEKVEWENHLMKMGVLCFGPDDRDYSTKDYYHEALALLHASCSHALLTTTDYPLFGVETIKALQEAEVAPVLPAYHNASGFPLFAGTKDLLQTYESGEAGTLEAFLHGLTKGVRLVPVNDSGVIANLGASKQWQQLLDQHRHTDFRPVTKLMIAKDSPCFGPGTYQLLEAIDTCHSVRNACRLIGLSYSKGWRMIHEMEEAIGVTMVARKKGGDGGGQATLTPKGRLLLERYALYVKSCNEAIDEIFAQHYSRLMEDLTNYEESAD
ncbi:molybdate transport repressor ModE-like protein [Lachnospiraceae bacterium PF1-22]|uniref:winged helix-turn-helix domain-containing protein n=1 Tax=Ohessyouella blattaphilus TaxID=2949333 RepID=UPI003E2E8140